MGWLAGSIGAVVAAGIAIYVAKRPASASADPDGWTELRPRRVVHASVALGAGLTALFAGVLLSGGSQRPDAAQQNVYLGILLAGFALMTAAVAWQAYATQVGWRGRRLRVRRPWQTATYDFADIVRCHKTDAPEELLLTLHDGRRLKLTNYQTGLAEFEESLARHSVKVTTEGRSRG